MLCERKTLCKDGSMRSIERLLKGCMMGHFPSADIRTVIESYFQKCKLMKPQAICTKCSIFQLDRTIQFCHVEFSATNCSIQIVGQYQYIDELQCFVECCKSVEFRWVPSVANQLGSFWSLYFHRKVWQSILLRCILPTAVLLVEFHHWTQVSFLPSSPFSV